MRSGPLAHRLAIALSLSLSLSIFASGCGGTEETITNPQTPSEFYQGWFQVDCAASVRCCHATQSVSACTSFKAAYLTGMPLAQIDDKIASGKMVFDRASAAACLAARRGARASCAAMTEGPFPDCAKVFQGTQPNGAACTFHFCDDCIPVPLPFSDCTSGSFCFVPGDQSVRASGDYTGVCQPFTSVGAACQNDEQCASDHCDMSCAPPSSSPIYLGC